MHALDGLTYQPLRSETIDLERETVEMHAAACAMRANVNAFA